MTAEIGTIAISFDTDHMSDARMEEFLRRPRWPGRAVMFCTRRYDCLSEDDFELAPHPYLPQGANWEQELTDMRQLFPRAQGWRSHSCVYSQMLGVRAARDGYLYVSTNEAHGVEGLQPTVESWGVVQMPIYYMDNCDFSRNFYWPKAGFEPFDRRLIERAMTGPGLYVFDFHPIHLMLNSPDIDYYMARRQAFLDGVAIEELVYDGRGAATFFTELCGALESAGRASEALGDIAARHAPAGARIRPLPEYTPTAPRAEDRVGRPVD